jgi:hypothetical protein
MRRLLALALCLVTAGCLSEPTVANAGAIVGTWTLQSVNNAPLPYTYPTGKAIVSETLSIGPDGSFTSLDKYSDGTEYVAQGVYTLLGNEIEFYDALHNTRWHGTWSATSIVQIFGSFELQFRKST